jgi:hypothetical protein
LKPPCAFLAVLAYDIVEPPRRLEYLPIMLVLTMLRTAAGFTMDDVEATEAIPVGKGKVFANALVKLGHVQLRVVYGQGTVYYFV